MLYLLEKFIGRRGRRSRREEARCTCGGALEPVPGESGRLYFCRNCNKLLCYVDRSPGFSGGGPLSQARLKKK
ncbi:MAG: hypothetical protein K6T29_03095 [Peptococcaceae bacterium]|nr:hypothetical protein [Peptococcaceae bacterium]